MLDRVIGKVVEKILAKRGRATAAQPAIRLEEMEGRRLLAGDGLAATYFDNDNFTGAAQSRVDSTVNFGWGSTAPISGIGADTFSARWTGEVEAPASGAYTFYTQSDDGVRLWVNGQQIINDWTAHATKENRGVVSLELGKKYSIKLEYFEKYSGATMKLLWSGPGVAKQVIPQAKLYSASVAAPVPSPVPVTNVGTGDGLAATFFDNENLTGTTATRTDRSIDFNWGTGGPASGIGGDTFSARWTGQMLAQHTQEYTFHTLSDDGVRLWVNGQQIINNWTAHAPTENVGRIRLEAGKKYDLKLEYFERSAGAVLKLYWSGANTAKQIVPTTQLYAVRPVTPPSGIDPTPVPDPDPVPAPTGMTNIHGLLGTYYKNINFSGSSVTRYDPQVAFDWGTSSPHEVIGSEQWAARWTGQVVPNRTELHTFHVTTDGGARLWVDGKLIVDDWAAHTKREKWGTIFLDAGKRYDIKLEFYDDVYQATMQLRWSSAGTAKAFIPSANLYASAPPVLDLGIPGPVPNTGFKVYTNDQVNRRPGSPTDKTLMMDGYNIAKIPIDHKGMNIAVTDLVPGQKAWAYRDITVRNTEISSVYRTNGYHNDFIRIAGAAGRQDVPMNVTLENIWIHDGTAVPILITDGDYDTIVIRNVKITGTTVNQLQINTQQVGSVKRIIVENCPGLSVAIVGRAGTIGEAYVRNSPGARVSDSFNQQGTKSGVKITVLP
jgi:hypothetical protein